MARVPIEGNMIASEVNPDEQERVVDEMWQRDIIKPYEQPLPPAIMETGVGYSGMAFTILDEFEHELVAVLPPRTYVFSNGDRFNCDVFKMLAEVLKTEAGRKLVEERGWSIYIP